MHRVRTRLGPGTYVYGRNAPGLRALKLCVATDPLPHRPRVIPALGSSDEPHKTRKLLEEPRLASILGIVKIGRPPHTRSVAI